MAELVNIRRDVADKYYRYKMPKLMSKIEGRGNGIKTVIPNMADVAKALARPATYPTKFFGFELGAQSTIDIKNEKYIVTGAHDVERLRQVLDAFIVKFVLCPSCMNPETELVITKTEEVIKDCKACGATKPVDMRHKLVAYILKNPPEKMQKTKPIKAAQDQNDEGESTRVSNDNGDDALTKRINEEVKGMRVEEDQGEWKEDTSVEAVAARMRELAVGGAVDKLLEADEDLQDPLDIFAEFVGNGGASAKEVCEKAESMEIRNDRCAAVLAQILFSEEISAKDVNGKAAVLKMFLTDAKACTAFLGGIERFVAHRSLLPKIANILKYIYDADLIDEEIFLSWGEKSSKKYVEKSVGKEIRAKAEPFLNWLREAESEESDSE